MTPFLIGGAVALAAAAYFWWQAHQERQKLSRLLAVEASTTGRVRLMAQTAAEAAGAGAYREHVELSGTAAAGPHGLLTAELSGTACVWHHHRVTRRYRERYRDSEGRTKTRTKEEVVTELRSPDVFHLRDAEGEIALVPSTGVEGARKAVSRFEEGRAAEGTTLSFGSFSFQLPGRRDDTIGYEYEEWLLLPDARLFVQGEASDDAGVLEVRTPAAGGDRLVITTRSEQELVDSAGAGARQNRLFAIVASAAALLIPVVGLVVSLV